MKSRFLLSAFVAMALAACSAPLPEGNHRPANPARQTYNPATQSYEWQHDDGRTVTGSYQP